MNDKDFVIYGTPTCRYCTLAKGTATAAGKTFSYHDVTRDPEAEAKVLAQKALSGHSTFPFVYAADGTFIGGADDLEALLYPKAVTA